MQLFLRIIKTSWQGFWRNGWLSLVAIFIMVQVLLLVGIFLSLNVGVGQAIRAINNQIDLAVFFKEYVPAADITNFQARIENIENVKSVEFISQEQALARYIANSQHNRDLIEAIDWAKNKKLPLWPHKVWSHNKPLEEISVKDAIELVTWNNHKRCLKIVDKYLQNKSL